MTDDLDPLPGDERSMRERMLAGDLYLAEDPELLAMRIETARRCAALNAAVPGDDVEAHRARLRALFASFGEGSNVLPRFHCDYGSNIAIGERTFVNVDCVFLDTCAITVGDDVQIAPKVQLLTATHPLDAALRMAEWESGEPITLGRGVWLGGGVIVCPGVTVGERTVVGAGTVVTKDLPADVLAVGNPARVVRSLP
jgi:maltose O-acetyltransferase